MALDGGTVLTKFKGDTSDLEKSTNNAKSKLSGLKSVFGKVAGGITAAYTAAMPVVVQTVKSTIRAHGELEQQIGGTEAVFGEFASQVQEQAKQSYKTMGTSADEYMASINKMASILQGSGYTVEESMNSSMNVMKRAADVASVMGITNEEAMNAVTAAAKGNFSMMDNLGVKMSATSIEAYAMAKGIKKSYNEMSEGEKTGLAYEMFLEKTAKYAGNVEKENKTMAGSMKQLTSAWENFLSGAGGTEEVIDSIINVIDTFIPKIVELAPQLINGVVQIINALIPQIPNILIQLLPSLIEGAKLLLIGLIEALPQFVIAIAEALPDLIPIIVEAIMALIPALIENLPLFIEAGIKLMLGLVEGIIKSIPKLIEGLGKIAKVFWEWLKSLPQKFVDAGKRMLEGLWNGIKNVKQWILNKLADLGKSILGKIKGIFGIKSPSKEFAIIGKFCVLGYTEALDDMQKDVQKQVGETFGISPQLANSSALHYSPSVNVVNNINMKQDPLGQMVNDIKTFSGGSKNDYNYGMGV